MYVEIFFEYGFWVVNKYDIVIIINDNIKVYIIKIKIVKNILFIYKLLLL